MPLPATLVLLALVSSGAMTQAPSAWPPARLADTGLYSDFASKTIDPRHLAFAPQYTLWSDGASKLRWISLPPGTAIDASDPERWEFPVGTRFWKQFTFARRAETRFIERTPQGWQFAAYAWNDDESDASLVPERGLRRSVPIADGVFHAIPSRDDCRTCHEAGLGPILGFSALQLSPDRDPQAPHREPPPPGGVDLRSLVDRGLLRGLPRALVERPPRIAVSTPRARAALGYMHANCGICHNDRGPMANLSLVLSYPLGHRPGDPLPVLATTLDRPSKFVVAGERAPVDRVRAQDPDASVLVARMASRHPVIQMPPLGSRVVDRDAVALVREWIARDVGPAAPASPPTLQQEDR